MQKSRIIGALPLLPACSPAAPEQAVGRTSSDEQPPEAQILFSPKSSNTRFSARLDLQAGRLYDLGG